MNPTPEMLLKYAIEMRQIEDGGDRQWYATIPDLGRYVFKGYGETPDQALKSLMEIGEDILNDYKNRGISLPEPSREEEDFSGRVLLRMPKYLHARLNREASLNNISLNSYIVSVLSDQTRAARFEDALMKLCWDHNRTTGLLAKYLVDPQSYPRIKTSQSNEIRSGLPTWKNFKSEAA